jgi:endonuclease/exonuclease/phosphatase family metal-dependent hydrolase
MTETIAPDAKIIQANVWFGRLLPSLLEFIKEEQPDVLCTQEDLITPDGFAAPTDPEVHERLAEQFPYQFFAPAITFDLEDRTVTQGNAIYSRWPIENKRTIFTSGSFSDEKAVGDFDYNVRNIQLATVRMGNGKELTVANHHGHHELNAAGSERSVESMRQAAGTLAIVGGPLIVCGDFNVNPQSPAMRPFDDLKLHNLTVEHGLTNTLSTASAVPRAVVCDYILVNNEVQVKSFGVSEQVVSDHKALIMEFEV